MSINLYPNPDEPVVAKRTCPPVPCGGDLSALGGSRYRGPVKFDKQHAPLYFGKPFNWGEAYSLECISPGLFNIVNNGYSHLPLSNQTD